MRIIKQQIRIWVCFGLAISLGFVYSGLTQAEAIRNIDEFLVHDGKLPFSNAHNRIAVFTFEDPDDTGLGDTLAFLTSKQILFDAHIGSLAIILFQQGLAPQKSGLGYFEKVEKLTADHGFIAAIWGHIAREQNELVVDSYIQLFPKRASRFFNIHYELSKFEESLRASIAPKRIWVNSIRLPVSDGDNILAIAESVRSLRIKPRLVSDLVPNGYLGEGATYRVLDREGDWTHLILDNGIDGWTSINAQCDAKSHCADILSGAHFLNNALRYANWKIDEVPTSQNHGLSAQAVSFQVHVLEILNRERDDTNKLREVIETTRIWAARKDMPGTAAFANLHALARLYLLQQTRELNQSSVREVANKLAQSSLEDPGNLDVLHNLTVLFQFLGDENKTQLAHRLYNEQLARTQH